MSNEKPYNVQLRVQNIGPHENATLPICMGETGPFKIGIFSTNGSGKTSLSRQFRLLRQKNDLKDGEKLPDSDKFLSVGKDSGKFRFKFHKQESTINEEFEISHSKGNVPAIQNNANFIFHVFNSDYVKETIEPNNFGPDESISGYIIGKEAVDVSKEKKELSEKENQYEKIKASIDKEIENAQNELNKIGIRSNTTEYKEVNFDTLISDGEPTESETFESLKSKLKKLENIPEDLKGVPKIGVFTYDFDTLGNLVSELNKVITPSSISGDFKEKIKTKEEFVESGLKVLDDKDNKDECPFCEQELKKQQLKLIDQYIEFFEDAETKYKKGLDDQKQELNRLRTLLQGKYNEYLKVEKAYNRVQDYFPSYSNSNLNFFEDPNTKFQWDTYVNIIDEKKESVSTPIDKDKLDQIENVITSLRKFLSDNIEQGINTCNDLIDSLNETRTNTNNEILSLKRRICKAKLIPLKSGVKTNIQNLKEKKAEITAIKKKIEETENRAKYPKKDKVAGEFKVLIKFIFDDKYVFDEGENCLKFKNHLLRNSAQDILSDGEKSIIAFCQYLAEVHRVVQKEADYDKLFFIVDDPVSSMDFHFTYSISTLLGELQERLDSLSSKANLKLIILTHNIEFMSVLSRNNVLTRSGYVLTPGTINKLQKELIMPYQEHLMDVYKVAEKGIDPNHTTPNSMRHILETINKFERPGNNYTLRHFITDNEELKECSGIHTLIQDGSHGYIRDQSAVTPEQVKKGCKTIIRFISNRYEKQITHIKSSVKNI